MTVDDRDEQSQDREEGQPEEPRAEGPEDPRAEGPQAPADEAPTQPLSAGVGSEAPPARRLVRPRDGRVIGGVCAGIARYFNTDPVIIRIAAVVLALFGGAGVLLYIAALLLMPAEPVSYTHLTLPTTPYV